jgi:predicted transcriptional regulator of viral defense system
MTSTIIKRFEKNGGFFRSVEKLTRSEKYQLKVLLEQGKIFRIKRGLYRLKDHPNAHQESEVANIVPGGIICMYTAWAHYNLTTHISSEYHIAQPKSIKIRVPDYPPIKVYYWNEENFELGLTFVKIDGTLVRIYDLERSVCDAVKFRNKVGTEVLSEIMKNYIRKKDKNLDKLFKYASKLRISKTLNQYLQVML